MARRRTKKNFRKLSGILLLDKPLGMSSNQALQRVRHLFKAEKAGHTGSLDPLATGMLPVCFGEATKVSAYLLDSDKTYQTTAQLGETRATGDAEGDVLQARAVPDLNAVDLPALLEAFTGDIQQVPPMYSALKKDGKPLYALARQGIEVERKARPVTIHDLQLLAQRETALDLSVHCSKGTYIRTLVEDMGEQLGCGAYVSMLRRTAVTPFSGAMHTLESLQHLAEQGLEALDALLLPIDHALPHLPTLTLDAAGIECLRHGQRRRVDNVADTELLRVYSDEGVFVGLAHVAAGVLSPKRLMSY